MREMDVAMPNGESYAGGPAVVVGYEGISDRGANFIEVGRTQSGQPILREFGSPELDRQLQGLIVSHASGGTIPTGLSYALTPERVDPMDRVGLQFLQHSPMARYCVTGDCAAGLQRNITAADFLDMRNENGRPGVSSERNGTNRRRHRVCKLLFWYRVPSCPPSGQRDSRCGLGVWRTRANYEA